MTIHFLSPFTSEACLLELPLSTSRIQPCFAGIITILLVLQYLVHDLKFFRNIVCAIQGFAELEYGMLRYMGAIDDKTLIVTSVRDRQLVDDIPVEKLLIHDVPVDVVCTPTQVIFTNTSIPKPQGIYWDKLSPEKLGQIRILRELKRRIEQETGQTLPCGPSEQLPPTAQRKR
eukprot:TRINITY_DN2323_c1_g1_i3.p1 TRINITY_DN2323_c1_g1~~TRINITY_DN2323_c1_g1_i3.p1  ORF type:complete len:174 (-),score=25.26 TRINITY_DN2323_c1_g1_i3:86-607(-)